MFEYPLITVITVCRNAVDLIVGTMQSVLDQDYPRVEYILVDGASTDGTRERIQMKLDSLPSRDGWSFHFISEPDQGIYDAMNKGLRLATGAWVNFMNAGDAFVGNHVLQDIFGEQGAWINAVRQGLSDSVWVIGGHTLNLYPDGHTEEVAVCPANAIPRSMPFSHQASFTRIQPETFCFGMNYRLAADYKFVYDLYYAYGEQAFLMLPLPIARYRIEGSLTSNPHRQRQVKSEYLRIQAAHRTWHWWKEYLKFRLL